MCSIRCLLVISVFAQFVILAENLSQGFVVSESQQLLAKRWKNYKLKFNLRFEPSDEIYRLSVYRKNMEYIHLFNDEGHGFTLGENQFTHWTHEEYLLWLEDSNKVNLIPEATVGLSEDIMKMGIADRDWRASNKVTSVKNQGSCGSCYAFSTTAATESALAIKTGTLVDLSPQDIVDCSALYGNKGCSGGGITRTFSYIRDIGVVSLATYPYSAKVGTCRRPNITETPVKITRYVSLSANNETILATAVSNIGPVTVAVDASSQSFQLYSSGIYYNPTCSSTAVNHGVVVVGIGSSPSDYYILKNSWSTTWGSQGYMQLARNQNNNCGVAYTPSYPVI